MNVEPKPADTSVLEKLVTQAARTIDAAQAYMRDSAASGITREDLFRLLAGTRTVLDLGLAALPDDPASRAVHAQAVEMVNTCLQTLASIRLSEFDVDGATPN